MIYWFLSNFFIRWILTYARKAFEVCLGHDYWMNQPFGLSKHMISFFQWTSETLNSLEFSTKIVISVVTLFAVSLLCMWQIYTEIKFYEGKQRHIIQLLCLPLHIVWVYFVLFDVTTINFNELKLKWNEKQQWKIKRIRWATKNWHCKFFNVTIKVEINLTSLLGD